jgi:hypothetical protein
VGAGGATAGGGVSSLPAPKGFHGATIPARQDQAAAQARKLLEFRLVITEVPGPLRAAVLGRLALNSPLPKALGSFYLQRGRGAH